MFHSQNRFELKYVVDAYKAKAFLADLGPFVLPDSHGGTEGFYRVTSLYYDTPDRRFYRDKVEGLKVRRKLRVRVYPGAPGGAPREAWVEIKGRTDRTVQKKRLGLNLADAADLCSGRLDPMAVAADGRDAAREVLAMVHTLLLEPSCVVSYMRRAFTGGAYDRGLRVTFDTGMTARARALDLGKDAPGMGFLHPGLCIVEVKVNDRAPRWMSSLLAAHDFPLQRISKYCMGLERTAAGMSNPFC